MKITNIFRMYESRCNDYAREGMCFRVSAESLSIELLKKLEEKRVDWRVVELAIMFHRMAIVHIFPFGDYAFLIIGDVAFEVLYEK